MPLSLPLYGTGREQSDEELERVKREIYNTYPDVLKNLGMIAGTPDNVILKLRCCRKYCAPESL